MQNHCYDSLLTGNRQKPGKTGRQPEEAPIKLQSGLQEKSPSPQLQQKEYSERKRDADERCLIS